MGLYDKIEEIRKKPEHIRMRYVWFMVLISMIGIIFLWWFSFKSKQIENSLDLESLRSSEVVSQFKEQKDSLKGTVNGAKNILDTQIQKQKTENPE